MLAERVGIQRALQREAVHHLQMVVRRLALAAALLLQLAAGAPPGLDLVCTTQEQLFTHLADMKSLCCGQLGEAALPWGDNPFPITCLTLECKRTVARISAACGVLLNSSVTTRAIPATTWFPGVPLRVLRVVSQGFFDDWKDQLRQTVDLCQEEAAQWDKNEYLLRGTYTQNLKSYFPPDFGPKVCMHIPRSRYVLTAGRNASGTQVCI